MKRHLYLTLIALIPLFLGITTQCTEADCSSSSSESSGLSITGKFLKGDHYLQTIDNKNYYKVVTDYSGGNIRLILNIKIGEQSTIQEIPIERLRFEKTSDKPHVRFRWREGPTTDINSLFFDYIAYIVMCTNEPVVLYGTPNKDNGVEKSKIEYTSSGSLSGDTEDTSTESSFTYDNW